MRYLLIFLVIMGFTAIFASCEYKVIKPKKIEVPDTVSFSQDILPIFDDCTKCHDGGTAPNLSENVYSNLTSGEETYINTANPEESKLYVKLADEGHQNVDQESIALILEWIKKGAPNN